MENGYHSQNEKDDSSVDEATKKRRDLITRELLKMRERDENAKLRQRAKKKEMKKLVLERLCSEKMKMYRPVNALPDMAPSKRCESKTTSDDTRLGTARFPLLKTTRSHKYDSKALPKCETILSLLANFWKTKPLQNAHLPEKTRQELTSGEISDLRMVFGIFDVKNRGFITGDDLEKAIGLLGFPTRSADVKNMGYETSKDKRGRITFKHFLQLVVKLQNGGADPVKEIVQLFHLLDQNGKGYITFADLKTTADDLKAGLSSTEIREMIQEADSNGDDRVSLQELTCIMKKTGAFI